MKAKNWKLNTFVWNGELYHRATYWPREGVCSSTTYFSEREALAWVAHMQAGGRQ